MTIPKVNHWTRQYVGEPYVPGENDCAALAVRVQREVFGRDIRLPGDRREGPFGSSAQIDALADDYAVPVDRPTEGDAVLMRCRGRLSHVGVYCEIGGVAYVLHAMQAGPAAGGGSVCLHRLRDLPRYYLIAEGYYRWR